MLLTGDPKCSGLHFVQLMSGSFPGEHYKDLPDETQTEETSPDLSTSTLRRKLFFHGEEGSPPSPVK